MKKQSDEKKFPERKSKTENEPMQKAMACVRAYHRVDELSDVNGSYTGYPLDGSKKPVQDADDL